MQLSSVRALKAQIAEQVTEPLIAQVLESHSLSVTASSLKSVSHEQPSIALGIAQGKSKKDYRLAVRIQRRSLDASSDLREIIAGHAKDEVDFQYVGRVTKRADDVASLAAKPWNQLIQRPLLIGCSVGHYAITAGTLGAFVLHRKSQRYGILSNNHVLANEDAGKIGDAILQPGAYDGGRRPQDQVATLLDFAPLKTLNNMIDAAVAKLDDGLAYDNNTLTGWGRLTGLRTTPLQPGDLVAKVGRTTGVTRGVVTAIELDGVRVTYERGVLSFDSQIEIEGAGDLPFSAGGDSGSVIVDEAGLACALLFAGGDQGGSNGKGLTFANEIARVLDQLNLELAI